MRGLFDRFRNTDVHPGDRQLIGHMRQAGQRLATRERETTHYLHFTSDADAQRAATDARAGGFDVEVEAPGDGLVDWQVRARHTILVEEGTITAARRTLTRIAESAGGHYDGWDAFADEALDRMSSG